MSKLYGRQGRLGLRTLTIVGLFMATMVAAFAWLGLSGGSAMAQKKDPQFTTDFRLEDCEFEATGENPYFILRPGYHLVLEGEEDGETVRVEISVLRETEDISLPDIGTVRTRVVEEKESVNGEMVEISRNWFAICDPTNDVFYFGEAVDIFNEDGTTTHDGSWRAGVDGATPGIIMPGTFLLGSRYFQEQAPDVAMDRAEHVEMGLEVNTQAGTFDRCVRVLETTPLEPGAESEKVYCPGVGLVVDDVVQLVEAGSGGGDDD